MKTILTFLVLSLLVISCTQITNDKKIASTQPDEINGYDSLLASKLGADEYGMKQYVMAFLKSGPEQSQDSATRRKIQRAHLDNITRLAAEGKLIVAGPFLDDTEIRGIFIFNVSTLEEARELTNSDPAVQSGRLVMELHPWYGSAALIQVNQIHNKIAKMKI